MFFNFKNSEIFENILRLTCFYFQFPSLEVWEVGWKMCFLSIRTPIERRSATAVQLLAETSSICCCLSYSGKYETSFWRVVTLNDRVATDINDDSQNGLWGCNLTFFVPFTLYGKNGSKIFPFRNTWKKSCRQKVFMKFWAKRACSIQTPP